MISPSEIMNKKFDKVMGRGYKVEDVDRFLEQIAGDLDKILTDKHDAEQKLLVLADKLEEYKNDEESLRAALLGAQKLGDSVVRDAKTKADRVLSDANTTAENIVNGAKKAIEREQSAFIKIQREVATFKSKLQLVYKQHLEIISSIPVDDTLVSNSVKAQERAAAQFEKEADALAQEQKQQAVETVAEEEPTPVEVAQEDQLTYSEHEEEPAPAPADEESYSDAEDEPQESRFGTLRFGKEYDLKREEKTRK